MKKEKSPVLVIFCIFLLSLLVILPPTFRKIFPKEEINDSVNQTQQKLIIVNCNIIYPNELYQVNSRTKYVEGNSPINTMTFTKLEILPENYTQSAIIPTTTASDNLLYLKSIPNIQYTENGNITTFTIDNTIISSLSDDQKILGYLSDDYTIQKNTFETLGYTCNILES